MSPELMLVLTCLGWLGSTAYFMWLLDVADKRTGEAIETAERALTMVDEIAELHKAALHKSHE